MAKKTKKVAAKNPPLYARKKTGRLVPCPGEAHDPRVGGMIDNCGLCAPRWGQVEELEPALTVEQVLAAVHEGFDVSASSVSDEANRALHNAGVKTSERTDKTSYGEVSFYVYRLATKAVA